MILRATLTADRTRVTIEQARETDWLHLFTTPLHAYADLDEQIRAALVDGAWRLALWGKWQIAKLPTGATIAVRWMDPVEVAA